MRDLDCMRAIDLEHLRQMSVLRLARFVVLFQYSENGYVMLRDYHARAQLPSIVCI